MLVLIGCSPSTGSSFLADLLDSIPVSLCGAELGIFSNRFFYKDYGKFSANPFCSTPSPSIYWLRNSLYRHALVHYGLDENSLRKIVKNSGSPGEFATNMFQNFRKFRGKNDARIWFEKTPLNSNCIGEFLDEFPDGKFVFLVRNPVNVYASLRRRHYSNVISACNWLVESAYLSRYRDHPNVILIRYEELVTDPLGVVGRLLLDLAGYEIDPEETRNNYEQNEYRKSLGRQKSWNINAYGGLGNANQYALPQAVSGAFASLLNTRISREYAGYFSLPGLSMMEACRLTGYSESMQQVQPGPDNISGTYSLHDRYRLMRKWVGDYLHGDTTTGDMKTYQKPIEFI